MNAFWSYWYFHIPNFLMAAAMYTLLGRLALGMFVPEDWDNFIWRGFKLITDPIVAAVRVITPQMIVHPVLLVFGALWLMVLRISYFIALANAGLAPLAAHGS